MSLAGLKQALGRLMTGNDTEYFRKRAVIERIMGITTNHPAVAAVHAELAERYEALVEEAKRPSLQLVASTRVSEAA